jgi:beta-glucosidase
MKTKLIIVMSAALFLYGCPGENKTITFKLNQEDFSYWNESKKDWTVDAGEFEIMVGASSVDIKLTTIFTVY